MAVRKPPVGAHYGLRDWLVQRVTAVLVLAAFVVLAVALIVCRPDGYAEWREFVGAAWVRLLLFTTVVALAWHAFIGARDIYMDYIQNDLLRLMKHVGVLVYLFVCVAWAAMILF